MENHVDVRAPESLAPGNVQSSGVERNQHHLRLVDGVTSTPKTHRLGEGPDWSTVWKFIEDHPDGGSLEEVGEVFGCTREYIRQVEVSALRKLQRAILRKYPNLIVYTPETIKALAREVLLEYR